MQSLVLKGVRQNNLKDFDIDIPLGKAVIVTGPSGSGKSSLAFETVYAEGQRRYMQSLSTYARQFLEKFKAPDVRSIQHIPPTIALEQINPVRNSRATVGTTTEIYDHLRLLFEKVGREFCETCDIPMERLTYPELYQRLDEKHSGQTIVIAFRRAIPKAQDPAAEILKEFLRAGYSRILVEEEVTTIEEEIAARRSLGKTIGVIVDRVKLGGEADQTRVTEALRAAMALGLGEAAVYKQAEGSKAKGGFKFIDDFTLLGRCPKCRRTSPPKTATSFSFNSPLGACETCKGFGNTLEIDEDLIVPDPRKSLVQGAIDPFTKPSLKQWQKKLLEFCKTARIDADLPYRELPPEHRRLVFEGDKKFVGVRGVFKELNEEKYKLRIRVFVSRYVSPSPCPSCHGARLKPAVLRVKVGDETIAAVCEKTFEQCQAFFKALPLTDREREIAVDILKQIDRRLDYLTTVGLGYLTLSRLTRSLSGGEYQRILLATQLSQGLTDTMYVLDEPSIGLHPKDTAQLLGVLDRLRALGNSLLLVEHDPEVILWGEHIIDMGPGSGKRGGDVLFNGSRERFLLSDTQTAVAVRDWKKECVKNVGKPVPASHDRWLEINGAAENNLQDLDVRIPLQQLVAITGVSGSGKSTLIVDTLYQALAKLFHGKSERIGRFRTMSGYEHLGAVELVDQSSIGKSSRSNPITFVKGYDEVRALFSQTRDAVAKRMTPGHFSFNVAGGRCEKCEGEGRVKVDLVFMEDIWVPCDTCDEKRFKPSVLAVKYRGRNIDDVLRMTIDEAYDFFDSSASLRAKLALLREVGLGYLQLGQPGFTLSGGEAQRLKIARELTGGSARRVPTLFILDEPTTGLHFHEISRLIGVLRRLVASQHSVIVIEHNLQLICAANYLVDLGPDGGEHGGRVVAVGTPKDLAQKKLPHTARYLAEILNQ